ncbi:TPA: hypothetical protein LEL88_003556 [Vibrio cholerae]|uniref:Uncharacterized protein n=1 Tax=Vibrio cholerae TaxID=666 RepID=A0AAW4KSS7_VIBCL|nr:hypothetical protein EEL44_01460 [Vibrio cholerae]KAE8427561.1 hypothetical protein A9965_018880 [Vibrio cholerae O1 biovar El Tor]MBU5841407.1 hypothetical protein [Vibrio cholerae O1]QJS94691.1 hypothetical protein GTF72_15225 [Vibrio cholerae C6706]QNE73085.1 hypothetical protein H6M50_16860 [Vibrio cholerae MO10]HAS4627713.1 hypothetical protein [Vibrio cholerae O1 biovar El Tor str. N16961]
MVLDVCLQDAFA